MGREQFGTKVNQRKTVKHDNYSQVINANAGATSSITITPPSNELWKIRNVRLLLLPPTGATAGTHRIIIGNSDFGTDGAWFDVISNYTDNIEIKENVAFTATSSKTPVNEQTFQNNIVCQMVSVNAPMVFWYSNNTTAGTQSGTLLLKITKEVEYVV